MGIKAKILFGFTLLIISIISVVSFWAAQSLGGSIEASDLKRLKALKSLILTNFKLKQNNLDKISLELAENIADINFIDMTLNRRAQMVEVMKDALSLDWLDLIHENKSLIHPQVQLNDFSDKSSWLPVRLSSSGPLSYHGHIISKYKVPGMSYTLIAAKKISLKDLDIPLFCIWDKKGIIASKTIKPEVLFLKQIANNLNTIQTNINGQLFRNRPFKIGNGFTLLVGYPAQRTSISKTNVNQLMIRLAILEVGGLLILGFFLGRKLFSPLSSLKNSIEQVAKGNWTELPLDKPPIAGSGDEIETVARSFNNMVRELSSAQKELIQVHKELAQKDKMSALGRFAAGIAHEINNPLGTILVSAGMIKEALNKNIKIENDDIELIIDEVRRCKNIILSLRTYTTRSKANLTLKNFKSSLEKIVEKVQKSLDNSFKIVSINDCPDGEILIDEIAIFQVLQNLIKNAFEATTTTSTPMIKVIFEKNEKYFNIKIHDNGPGFCCPPEQLFEPLVTTKALGIGLGLAICQVIAEGHDGKIEAKRIDGKITEFCIFLPVFKKQLGDNNEV